MTIDFADEASEHTERQLSDALKVRKPVPAKCECGKPVAILHNGAQCKYCKSCLASALTGHFDTL
jgi:hypothetical protein